MWNNNDYNEYLKNLFNETLLVMCKRLDLFGPDDKNMFIDGYLDITSIIEHLDNANLDKILLNMNSCKLVFLKINNLLNTPIYKT